MSATFAEYYLQLIDGRLGRPINDDTGLYNVLTASDPTELTIYSSDTGASQANPGTMTDGIIRFFTASSITSVDISILTAEGHAFFLEGITPSNHRVIVWPENVNQQLIIPYNCNTGCNVVVDTGFDIGASMLIKDVFLHITTAATAGPLDVGTSTDTDGFLDAAVVSVTGFTVLDETVASIAAGIGSLLVSVTSGAVRKHHVRANTTSGANIVYVVTATNSGGTGEGYVYVVFNRIPTAGN